MRIIKNSLLYKYISYLENIFSQDFKQYTSLCPLFWLVVVYTLLLPFHYIFKAPLFFSFSFLGKLDEKYKYNPPPKIMFAWTIVKVAIGVTLTMIMWGLLLGGAKHLITGIIDYKDPVMFFLTMEGIVIVAILIIAALGMIKDYTDRNSPSNMSIVKFCSEGIKSTFSKICPIVTWDDDDDNL